MAERWSYYPNSAYQGALPFAEWTAERDLLVSLGDKAQISREADIAMTNSKAYVVWLTFRDLDGNDHHIDGSIWKTTFDGEPNGIRHIDSRSPFVADVRRRAEFGDPFSSEELSDIIDILSSRSNKIVSSAELKLQYKLNGTVIEDAFKEACSRSRSVSSCIELDPFGNRIYKGSPGNLSDFEVVFCSHRLRIDVKLIKSADPAIVKLAAHDANVLICYDWSDDKVIVTAEKPLDDGFAIAESEGFAEFCQEFKMVVHETLKHEPFLRIVKIDTESNKILASEFLPKSHEVR